MDNKNKIPLDKIGKELPFSVPENYFDEFANQMDSQINGQKVPVRRMIGPWIYMAAMFIGIFFIGHFFYNIYQNSQNKKTEYYESYLLSQIDNVALLDFYMEEFDEY